MGILITSFFAETTGIIFHLLQRLTIISIRSLPPPMICYGRKFRLYTGSFIIYEKDYRNSNQEMTICIRKKRPTVLVWSGSKTALVELVYALYASQDINHGTADIKTLVAAFEDFLISDWIISTRPIRKLKPVKRTEQNTSLLLC